MSRFFIHFLLTALPLLIMSSTAQAVTISQCVLPDGSIEFTNQGCSKSNQLHSRRTFSNDLTRSQVIRVTKTKRKPKLFKQRTFVGLQKKLINAQSMSEMKQHSETIIDAVKASAQQGQIMDAYDMIAATYVNLSKYVKQKNWEGKTVESYIYKFQSFFEYILVSQSTTSTANELTQVIQKAWQTYSSKHSSKNTIQSDA